MGVRALRDRVFGVPRTIGRDHSNDLARALAVRLDEVGFATVAPVDPYQRMEEELLSGQIDAAWAPPMVCARVEDAGGRVVLRARRGGASTYRAVILRPANWSFTLAGMRDLKGLRAVWSDPHSMAGFVLPRHALRAAGIDLGSVFIEEALGGSYQVCLEEVLAVRAHVTATYCSLESATASRAGHERILGPRAAGLAPIGYTEATPHDGIVISPRLGPADAAAVEAALLALVEPGPAAAVMAESFDADGFEPAPAGSYRALLGLL